MQCGKISYKSTGHTFVIMKPTEKIHLPVTAIPYWKCTQCGKIKKSM